jgi:hypothetical protein
MLDFDVYFEAVFASVREDSPILMETCPIEPIH